MLGQLAEKKKRDPFTNHINAELSLSSSNDDSENTTTKSL